MIVVLRLVDPGRNRPHPHQAGRERSHEVARVRLIAELAGIITWRDDDRHAVMDLGNQFIGIGGDDRESPNPVT